MTLNTLFGLLPATLTVDKYDYAEDIYQAAAPYTAPTGFAVSLIGIALLFVYGRKIARAADHTNYLHILRSLTPHSHVIKAQHVSAQENTRELLPRLLPHCRLGLVLLMTGLGITVSPTGVYLFLICYYP